MKISPQLKHLTDRDLITIYKQGNDEEYLRELMARHIKMMVKIAKSYFIADMDLDDKLSCCYRALWGAVIKYDPSVANIKFSTYLYTGLSLAMRSQHRRQENRTAIPVSHNLVTDFTASTFTNIYIESHTNFAKVQKHIYEAIGALEGLTPAQQQGLIDAYFTNKTYSEIEAEVCIKGTTIRRLAERQKKRLKHAFDTRYNSYHI